jgi:thioredoxin 1
MNIVYLSEDFYLYKGEKKMAVLNVTEENFEAEVSKSDLPVLADFWASWCGPCRMIAPIVEEISEELKGKLKVVKINVDEAQELAGSYHVMSIPTLIIFKGGEPVAQVVGAMSKDQLLSKINANI